MTPVTEIVNTLEMAAEARRILAPGLMALLSDRGRRDFDRITFRPRMMVDTRKMDLSVDLFGEKHFAPILVGPVHGAERFGKGDIARAASAAKTAAWSAQSEQISGSQKVHCLTLAGRTDWAEIDKVRKSVKKAFVLKGILTSGDAAAAVEHGVDGIVVSAYRPGIELAPPLLVLPEIAKAVNKRIPILLDGGIRRGSDVIKAIALGATAVLVARPVLWALAAYGETGVRTVLEMLQTEMARDMAMLGKLTPAQLGADCIRVHSR